MFGWCGFASVAAGAAETDPMDTAGFLYQHSPRAETDAGGGAVAFRKVDSGDAFVRWSLAKPGSMPLTPDNEQVQVDFAGFADGSSVDLVVVMQQPSGRLQNVTWRSRHRDAGPVVLESVSDLARRHGVTDVSGYHLFFRMRSDPTGTARIERIRLSARGDDGANVDAAGPAAGIGTVGYDELILDLSAAQPDETGITLDRGGVSHESLRVGSRRETAWVAREPFGVGESWQRSMRFDITDPAFVDGRRNSVDLEVTYMLDAWGSVRLVAATNDGPREIGTMWGDTKGRWKTGRVRLNNAAFDNAIEGRFDLRLAGDNGPLVVKRVRLLGYRPTEDVRWDRVLEVTERSFVNSLDTPLFVARPGEDVGVRYTLRNHAAVAPEMAYDFVVEDRHGEAVHHAVGRLTIESGGATDLEPRFSTDGWPLGPYTARLTVGPADASPGGPKLAVSSLVGVIDGAPLAKARPGEFRFGLDTGHSVTSPEALAFYRIMGVDLLRSGTFDSRELRLDNIEAAFATLEAQGVGAMLLIDPPGQMDDIDEPTRQRRLAELLPRIETIARTMRGRITYYELGNEPDLPFFYPGPIESYVDSFERMSQAIKRGNPDALVMNGGLCFFGEDGDRRARRFIDLVDPRWLDLWAYHGHGPGVGAERDAYQRQVDAVMNSANPRAAALTAEGQIGYLDTETGFNASLPSQHVVQARTGVQKTVFAQAQGMPSLMWFRLFMGNSTYTLSHHRVEPRPTVLAYRAMVQRLRHAHFVRMLDLGTADLEAYVFEHRDEVGRPTGRKAIVAWSGSPASHNVSLRLSSGGADVERADAYDLYGNATPLRVRGETVAVTVGLDPVYVVWESATPIEQVAWAPPAITPSEVPALDPQGTTRTRWLIRNHEDRPVRAELVAEAVSGWTIGIEPTDTTAQIPAKGQAELDILLDVNAEPGPSLPRWWHVFVPVSGSLIEKPTPQKWAEVPDSLPGGSGGSSPQRVWVRDGKIDLAEITGGYREKMPAMLFATIESDKSQTIRVGAAADWWMRWYVNGQEVYSTMDRGNRGAFSPDTHQFELPLSEGSNTIAVQVLSGSAGFQLVFGDDADIELATSGGVPRDRIDAQLLIDGQPAGSVTAPLELARQLPAYRDLDNASRLADWVTRKPVTALRPEEVTNFHEAFPDSNRWYGGTTDLSAVVWASLVADADAVDIVVAVRDDQDTPAVSPRTIDASDHLRLSLLGPDSAAIGGVLIGVDSAGKVLTSVTDTTAEAPAVSRLSVTREGDYTRVYRFRLSRSANAAKSFNLDINDYESGIRKQETTTGPIPFGAQSP
ncbi:MAG: hypothetical protein AAF800_01210 [Planctomycetota bacterium]